MSSFLTEKNFKRYSSTYLNELEEINSFDPVLYIELVKDYYAENRDKFYICNRQVSCSCSKTDCACDDDEYISTTIKIDLVSNCKCNVEIILHEKHKLNSKLLWNNFILNEDDSETSIIVINPKKSSILFMLPSYKEHYTFTTEDPIRQHKNGIISFQFNYMQFIAS